MTEPPANLILAKARLVLAGEVIHGCQWLRGGVIAAVDSGSRIPAAAVDCDGDLVQPGLVELQTDNLEWHIQPRPGVGWLHSAAILAHDAELAGAGITSVFDAIRVGSILTGLARHDGYARPLATEVPALRDRRAEDQPPPASARRDLFRYLARGPGRVFARR